ncbi:hypothetical protein CYMTET_35041 [Cymbomonas tetramitiformis]|uniref:L-ascorbate peroxidase n=1 Tax=Cymbomonas tetramitiformis TaxID=36881 RepID=A0AAE0KPA2_9CHLO|nr:hypothetical protein CYMTET_35041 [Cymbomonas tetramitiformis]
MWKLQHTHPSCVWIPIEGGDCRGFSSNDKLSTCCITKASVQDNYRRDTLHIRPVAMTCGSQFVFLCMSAFGMLNGAQALSVSEAATIKADIEALIPGANNNGRKILQGGGGGGGGGRGGGNERERGDIIGVVVRLAFHDAGTFSTQAGNGGMDGCVLWDDADNGGLTDARDMLAPVYESHSSIISLADFWSLASITMIEAAGGPVIPFQWGRIDATSCATDAGRLPDAEQSHAHVVEVFTRLGFTTEEMVALMGAHTLGRCQTQNSGYNGPWVNSEDEFDNEYYRDLVGDRWDREERTTDLGVRHQWEDGNRLMLNTDMTLAFDIDGGDGDPNAGQPNACGGNNNNCAEQPSTRGFVDTFRTDQAAWFTSFTAAFVKMLGLGQGALQDLTLVSSPTQSSPPAPLTSPPPPSPSSPPPSPSPSLSLPPGEFAILTAEMTEAVKTSLRVSWTYLLNMQKEDRFHSRSHGGFSGLILRGS